MAGLPLNELAHDWLRAKTVTAGTTTTHSDRARRQDLARWGRLLGAFRGLVIDERLPYDVDADLAGLVPTDLSVEALLEALAHLKRRYQPATVERTTSTMRSFTRWLVTRGHLAANPFDDEVLHVRGSTEPEVRAFSPEDVERMLAVADDPAPSARSAWRSRDAAIVSVLAHCGLRAGELCALRVGDLGGADRPVLHIRHGAKGNRRRDVPVPRLTFDVVQRYLTERVDHSPTGDRMFVRLDGRPMTTDALYHLIKRLATAAGATLPLDAMAHGLRHHYGLQLAIRGVPVTTLQQLMGHRDPRTTSLYTRHASYDLINALDDAGWLT